MNLALDADESKFPKITDANMGAAQFGYENLKWKQTPNPDGSLPLNVWQLVEVLWQLAGKRLGWRLYSFAIIWTQIDELYSACLVD